MTDHFPDIKKMVPERIVLSADAFDALQRRLNKPGRYDPRVAKVLTTPAPWDKNSVATDPQDSLTNHMEHPITPPPELVGQWAQHCAGSSNGAFWRELATQAANWGYKQAVKELEAFLKNQQ